MALSHQDVAGALRRRSAPYVVGAILVLATTILGPTTSAGGSAPPTRSHFKGNLHILLVEQPWSSDSGHWGGFSFSFTLAADFQQRPLSKDVWTLGIVYIKSPSAIAKQPSGDFTLVQTVPAGLSGTCVATYHFHVTEITGDIGGFIRTADGYSATVDLGLTALAPRVDNNGCGTDLEETTHPFGGHQQFDVPVQVTGHYADRELSFRTASHSDVAGGDLVTKIDGALKNE